MKRSALLLLLGLLVACTDLLGVKLPSLGPDDVPNVARTTRLNTPNCSKKGLLELISGGDLANLRYVNPAPESGLKAQASASTLLGLLFETRKAINTNYYGFSTTDLQALHKTYETKFRSALGNLNGGISANADALMNQYVDSLGDKHSYYLDTEQYRGYTDKGTGAPTSELSFGFEKVAVPGENGAVIINVDGNGPSFGVLRRGDVILAVNGQALGSDSKADSSVLDRATKSNKPVTFSIRRNEALQTITVTPRIIESPDLPTLEVTAGTALLRVPSFLTPGVAQEVHNLLRRAQGQGASGLVMDLRDNKGGSLAEATGITAAFAPKQAGQTLETLDAQDITFTFESDGSLGRVVFKTSCSAKLADVLSINLPAVWTGKIATIVNAGSASASEVVSNILRKTGAAAVGETTVGVGNTAILPYGLPGKRSIVVTIARSRGLDGAYLPDKVIPDIRVADDLKQLAHGRDLPLEAAMTKVQ